MPLPRLSLSVWILLGLGAGVLTGLFFGEPASVLEPLADVYIRLMQMTVLPYLVLALVTGFGQLDGREARRLAVRAAGMLLVVWALTFSVLAAMPLAFPPVESASFFSHSLVEPRRPFSIPDLYFTDNPFHSLSNAVVPAVVLFSSMTGIALLGLRDRETVLAPLRVMNAAITRITLFVVRLTPVGVFAIAAVAAGTMKPETLQRLEAYFVAFAAASLVLAFWVLPLLVTAVTPFRYREVVGVARDALLTAFVANNAFIVLPIIVERSRELLRERGHLGPDTESATEVLVPILFNFPNAGKLLTLLFLPFAAWLSGQSFSWLDQASLFAVGLPTYFAKAQVALPFLMDLFGLPHDLFQLYIPTTILTGKLDSMVTAMNLLVFALLGAASMGGFLVFDRRRILLAASGAAGGIAVATLGAGLVLSATLDTTYDRDEALRRMHSPRTASPATALPDRSGRGEARATDGLPTLRRIRESGRIRIGYDPVKPPFSFFNLDDELVGFDVELSQQLAEALGVEPDFVRVDWPALPEQLESGAIDVMPGMWYRPYWFSKLRLTEPYLEGTVGLVVEDARRHEFDSIDRLRRSRGLRIGVPLDTTQLAYSMRRYFGDADVEFVTLESPSDFFEGGGRDLDAFLMPAESGSAATLLHPRFSVVVPQPDPVRLPIAFGVATGAQDLADVIDEWVLFARSEGAVDRAYAYWILGQGAEDAAPRWSILRDVLGWGREDGR